MAYIHIYTQRKGRFAILTTDSYCTLEGRKPSIMTVPKVKSIAQVGKIESSYVQMFPRVSLQQLRLDVIIDHEGDMTV